MKLQAKNVSIGEAGDEYFQVSFDSEVPNDDDFDLSGPDHPYLIVQRQFEDDDGGVCYIAAQFVPALANLCRLARCTKVVGYLRCCGRGGRTAAIAGFDPFRKPNM